MLFGDLLVLRLREAGLADTLQQVLGIAPIDEASDPLAHALQLRRLGELAWERDTIENAGQRFTEALEVIDGAIAGGRSDVAIRAERAQILKGLGDVLQEKGEVTKAESRYTEAVQHWEAVIAADDNPSNQLAASEARIALGSLRDRMGDTGRAESDTRRRRRERWTC